MKYIAGKKEKNDIPLNWRMGVLTNMYLQKV